MNEFDTCIIGQGLAGSTLAWTLREHQERVAVIDREEPSTTSRIAAGLITPVTGKRFVKSRDFEMFRSTAVDFYRKIERRTNSQFLDTSPMARLFSSENERTLFTEKGNREFPELIHRTVETGDEDSLHAEFGGFEISLAARLNVARFLDVSREEFDKRGNYFPANIHLPDDLQIDEQGISISNLGIRARRVIFCQGFAGSENPWFRAIPFDAAKGEILVVRIPEFTDGRVIHRGVWLAPFKDDLYRVGATYDRDRLDSVPTPEGREELCTRLEKLLRVPFEVVQHQAGIRPIILGRRPKIGFHPKYPMLGYFNGLGSKGALQAPWLAEHFAKSSAGKCDWRAEFNVAGYGEQLQCVV
jgi:glycine oxidase